MKVFTEHIRLLDYDHDNSPMLGTADHELYLLSVFNLGHEVNQPEQEEAEQIVKHIITLWNAEADRLSGT